MFLFIHGCEDEFKISLREPRGGKIFVRSLPSFKKCRKYVLEVGCMGEGVGLDRE